MKDAKFTWEEINKVRAETQIGMWDAREALNATGGNIEEAIELINNFYDLNSWELRYKLKTFEERIKALEELVKEKNNE